MNLTLTQCRVLMGLLSQEMQLTDESISVFDPVTGNPKDLEGLKEQMKVCQDIWVQIRQYLVDHYQHQFNNELNDSPNFGTIVTYLTEIELGMDEPADRIDDDDHIWNVTWRRNWNKALDQAKMKV